MRVFRTAAWAMLASPAIAAAQRPLAGSTVATSVTFSSLSGARELDNGVLLVSDVARPALYRVDRHTGAATVIGSVGAGARQYVRPGGIYAGPGDSFFVMDRARGRLIVVDPAGEIIGERSIAIRGTRDATDRNVDLQQVDRRAHVYLTPGRLFVNYPDSATLLRIDPVTQRRDTVARLRIAEEESALAGGVTVRRTIIGSPEEAWVVAPRT